MIALTWASSIVGSRCGRKRGSRLPPSRHAAALERLSDNLFYRPTGIAGFLGRLGLLAVVAVLSYFLGAGVGAVIMKAPVPVALMISALLIGWANGDPDTD